MPKQIYAAVVVVYLFVCAGGLAGAKTIYVNANATGGNTGASWANAYKDLNSALAAAASGDKIWVAAGTYKPTAGTDRESSFRVPAGVSIYGGFAGNETSFASRNWTTRPTILSGNIGSTATTADNSYHVLVVAKKATLDGFTVRDGNADGTTFSLRVGAALLSNAATTMTVNNCTFRDNSATKAGSAIYNTSDAQMISNCVFTDNKVISGNDFPQYGGAIYISGNYGTIVNCAFSRNSVTGGFDNAGGVIYSFGWKLLISDSVFNHNTAPAGGAIYNANTIIVSGCTFRGNSVTQDGGAILNDNAAGTIANCTFEDNSATNPSQYGTGGAIAHSGSYGWLKVGNCTFARNSSSQAGGAIHGAATATITGSEFNDNVSSGTRGGTSYGGAIFGAKTVSRCTFINNTTEVGGAVSGVMDLISECAFMNNNAIRSGGAVYMNCQSEIRNCAFTGNSGQLGGGAIMANLSMPADYKGKGIINCTFSGNTAALRGGAIYHYTSRSDWGTSITNCVFWENAATTGTTIYNKSGITNVSNCDLSDWDGVNWDPQFGPNGGGNIKADPLFVNSANPAGPDDLMMTADDGLRLSKNSPCIDAGFAAVASATDILGNAREGAPDIGAYEYITPKNAVIRWEFYE